MRRVIGWLLTPAVVWAASFVGGWFGAWIGTAIRGADVGIAWLAGGAVLGGSAGLVTWVWRLKRAASKGTSAPKKD